MFFVDTSVSTKLSLLLFVACSRAEVPDFYGVRLGMVPRDVRDRFTQNGGAWTSEAAKDDFAIVWTAPAGSADAPENTKFEFHTGSLVAIRADVPKSAPIATGDAVIVTQSTVLKRTPSVNLVHVDILARACPTHAEEAKRLAEGH